MMLVVQQQAAPKVEKLDIAQLAKQHYDRVFRFCSTRVGYHHAGDAAQETFLTAQRNLAKFRGESQPLTWLIGIALNECRRVNRNLSRTEPLPEFKDETSQESQLINREFLRIALSKLSDEHREVVTLHEIDGFTYEEIAQITGVPVGTVKSRLFHAFTNLRKSIYSPETQPQTEVQ
ncbi:MAG: sigma-70 family RNA polymerase sigma factor [Armatimonadetes bacterium]|nr:sigma-70 family RNA polymerase sigma factor [Armatimonadota bacterium]MBS1725469.1 RNA polymerase sigma factor [Armatimonadota bacterium]